MALTAFFGERARCSQCFVFSILELNLQFSYGYHVLLILIAECDIDECECHHEENQSDLSAHKVCRQEVATQYALHAELLSGMGIAVLCRLLYLLQRLLQLLFCLFGAHLLFTDGGVFCGFHILVENDV